MNYIAIAKELGYTGSDEVLERVGMAYERGSDAWDAYELGGDASELEGLHWWETSTESERTRENVISTYTESAFYE